MAEVKPLKSGNNGDPAEFESGDTLSAKSIIVADHSFTCGRNQNISNSWLRGGGNVPLNLSPYLSPPYATELIAITATTNGNETWEAEIYKDGDISSPPTDANKIASLPITNDNEGSVDLSSAPISIPANTRLGVFVDGTGVNRPQVTLFFRRA